MLINCLPWGAWIAFCLFSSNSACWSPNGQLYCSLRDCPCHLSVPRHPSAIYMTRLLAYLLQVVMQISPDFCLETFHLSLLSQVFYCIFDPLHFIPFSFLSTLLLCLPNRAKSLSGQGFPLILFSPVFLILRTTCCMAFLQKQGVKEWVCAGTESWFSACGPVRILGRGLAAIMLLGIFWFPVICTACDIHCVRGFL